MRRRTLILSLTLAGLIGRLALPAVSVAAANDWTTLRVMPLSAAIRAGLQRDPLQPKTAAADVGTMAEILAQPTTFSAESLARIRSAPGDLRTLAWLAYLADQPLSDGSDGSNGDGLHGFFYLWDGEVAPQVADTLRLAGLTRKAAIFAKAMALFSDPYPTSETARAPRFGCNAPRVRVSEFETIVPDLNALDERLMALGRQFGPIHALWPDIQTWALGTPALAPWLNTARTDVTDEDRMEWLLSQLEFRMAPNATAIASAPHAYASLYAANLFNAEMLNGGVEQFFSKTTHIISAHRLLSRSCGIPPGLDHSASLYTAPCRPPEVPWPRLPTRR